MFEENSTRSNQMKAETQFIFKKDPIIFDRVGLDTRGSFSQLGRQSRVAYRKVETNQSNKKQRVSGYSILKS